MGQSNYHVTVGSRSMQQPLKTPAKNITVTLYFRYSSFCGWGTWKAHSFPYQVHMLCVCMCVFLCAYDHVQDLICQVRISNARIASENNVKGIHTLNDVRSIRYHSNCVQPPHCFFYLFSYQSLTIHIIVYVFISSYMHEMDQTGMSALQPCGEMNYIF